MISLGPIGVGDTLRIGNNIPGLPDLLNYAKGKATSMGLKWDVPPFPEGLLSINNGPFELAGVPAVGLYQSEDPNLNTPADTPDKINLATLEKNGELAAAVMYDWAKNPAKRARKGAGTAFFTRQQTTGLLEK